MNHLLRFQDSLSKISYIKEHQTHLLPDQKLFIAILAISFSYFLIDLILYFFLLDKEANYLALMLAIVFQFLRIILFLFYLKHASDSTSQRFLLIEKIFLLIFPATLITTWNLQIELDPSRAYIIGVEAGWTFLYTNTLFGHWPLKVVMFTSVSIFGLVKHIIHQKSFSLGPIQAAIQIGLVILTIYIYERQKREKVLQGISVEKTEQTLKSILNNIPENIAVINLEGDLIFYNEYMDVSFKISESPTGVEIFTQIYQIKPRERHVNLQKIKEQYNFIRSPKKKGIKNPLARIKRQGTMKNSPANSHLRVYFTEEFNFSNRINSLLKANDDQKLPRRHRNSHLIPSKTVEEFFASMKYFQDLQEVLDFFCANVELLKTYTHKENSFFIFDGKYNTKEGLVKSFEIKVALSSFNAEDGFVIILRDTTQRDIIVTLEDNNNFKDSVLASISHELRTPLNTNLNLLELAINSCETLETDQSHDVERGFDYNLKETYLIPAHKSGKLLESVINDVLDYSMLMARKFVTNIKEDYLLKSLDKIRYLCEFQAHKRNLEFHISLSQTLNYKVGTDHRRLRQILTNLLNNAIRFTNKGFVSLRIEPYPDNPDLIQFSVKDSGIGIAPDALERMTVMLDKGTILNKLNKEASGVGMGLTISNLLAQELGPTSGKMTGIKISSVQGEGSKFWFVIENWAKNLDNSRNLIKSKTSDFHVYSPSKFANQNNNDVNTPQKSTDRSRNQETTTFASNIILKESQKTLKRQQSMKIGGNIPTPKSVVPSHEAILRKEDEIDEEIACMIKDDNLRLSLADARLLKNDSRFPLLPNRQRTKGPTSEPSAALINQRKGRSEFPLPNVHIETLDVARSNSEGPSRRKPIDPSLKVKRDCICSEILVVDDDMFNLFTMENLLGSLGFKITKANNGEEAIKVVKRRSEMKCCNQCLTFKLIFMDLSMPVMDGFQATVALKKLMKDSEIPFIPIVACTAFVDQEKTEQCYECGMEGRISKPVNKNKLREVLKKYGIIEDEED